MDTSLVRSPVYQQLNQHLRAALAAEYHTGDQFLTEREVAEKFQVSRTTANKALASLVSEGFLEFRKGLGTFVRRDVIDYDVQSLVSFTEKARAAGKKPSTELITFGEISASQIDKEIQTALNVTGGELLWEMERRRLADGTPVILEHRYVVRRHCPKLTKQQAEGSLYRAWTKTHGLTITGADEVIRAVLLTADEARHLQVSARSPALEVVSVGQLDDNSPLWWERTLYRCDRYEFHSRLGPIQSATPARGKFRTD
ncbi:MAG: GntR family transcriptional regulator [Planctomycetaceae bacterium]|nr:MAG: GntR family transcriptional regulator [Planctomycetaceae bacterium]